MEKKLLKGALDKKIVVGLGWLIPVVALVSLIIDFKELDVEEKRTFVSVLVACVIAGVLGITIIVPAAVFVCAVIAAINAFMGKTFKVPGAYQIAAAIIK